MSIEATIGYCVGPSGSGKSYLRGVHAYLYEILPGTQRLITNVPINREAIAQLAADRKLASYEEAYDRIEVLPNSLTSDWLPVNGGGPWDLKNINGAKLLIDEIHNFAPKGGPSDHMRRWQAWLGELRHQGACVEFLTQDHYKVSPEIWHEAPLRLRLEPCWVRRDGLFKILMSDWYQLLAALRIAPYIERTWVVHETKVGSVWVEQYDEKVTLWPELFKTYNSYSAPIQGNHRAGGPKLREFQRYGLAGFLRWFLRRNCWQLIKRGVLPASCCAAAFVGLAYVFDVSDYVVGKMIRLPSGQFHSTPAAPPANLSIASTTPVYISTKPTTQPTTQPTAQPTTQPNVPNLTKETPQTNHEALTLQLVTEHSATINGVSYALGAETPGGQLLRIDAHRLRAQLGSQWLYLSAGTPVATRDVLGTPVFINPTAPDERTGPARVAERQQPTAP